MSGHKCKHLANKWVPWEENDCICNPNLVEEVNAEMEEDE
tara:strand:- start:3325 stop:3444 length:120 start_codon:yes stop_codon:yes gene_type:complete